MTAPRGRKPRPWDELDDPKLLAITAYRDPVNRITYMPWSDARLALIGWEVFPDRSTSNVLIYLVPNGDLSGLEIRCHATTQDLPNPETDQLLGTITIPLNMLGDDPK